MRRVSSNSALSGLTVGERLFKIGHMLVLYGLFASINFHMPSQIKQELIAPSLSYAHTHICVCVFVLVFSNLNSIPAKTSIE